MLRATLSLKFKLTHTFTPLHTLSPSHTLTPFYTNIYFRTHFPTYVCTMYMSREQVANRKWLLTFSRNVILIFVESIKGTLPENYKLSVYLFEVPRKIFKKLSEF